MLFNFNARKTQFVSFNFGGLGVKMKVTLSEKIPFKILGFSFFSKLDWCSNITFIDKSVSKKIEALIPSIKFLSNEIAFHLYKSTILPYLEHCFYAISKQVLLIVIGCIRYAIKMKY